MLFTPQWTTLSNHEEKLTSLSFFCHSNQKNNKYMAQPLLRGRRHYFIRSLPPEKHISNFQEINKCGWKENLDQKFAISSVAKRLQTYTRQTTMFTVYLLSWPVTKILPTSLATTSAFFFLHSTCHIQISHYRVSFSNKSIRPSHLDS